MLDLIGTLAESHLFKFKYVYNDFHLMQCQLEFRLSVYDSWCFMSQSFSNINFQT